jgi:hypothetical protein
MGGQARPPSARRQAPYGTVREQGPAWRRPARQPAARSPPQPGRATRALEDPVEVDRDGDKQTAAPGSHSKVARPDTLSSSEPTVRPFMSHVPTYRSKRFSAGSGVGNPCCSFAPMNNLLSRATLRPACVVGSRVRHHIPCSSFRIAVSFLSLDHRDSCFQFQGFAYRREVLRLSARGAEQAAPLHAGSKPHAAGDVQELPGDPACVVGGEEGDGVGDVGWLADPAERGRAGGGRLDLGVA